MDPAKSYIFITLYYVFKKLLWLSVIETILCQSMFLMEKSVDDLGVGFPQALELSV